MAEIVLDKVTKRYPDGALAVSEMDIHIKDGAFMPIHQQVTTWAARKGIDYVPRTDERTYAHNFKPS